MFFILNQSVGGDFFAGTKGTVLSRSDSTAFLKLANCISTLSSLVVSLQFSNGIQCVVIPSSRTEWPVACRSLPFEEELNHCVVTEAYW